MSDDEKDAIIGATVQEYTDAFTHAAALTATLIEMGNEFGLLARQLTTDPAKLSEAGKMGGPSKLNVAKAFEMAGQLRDAQAKVAALEQKLGKLGVPLHP